jgi:ribosomal RNA-processing protein 12
LEPYAYIPLDPKLMAKRNKRIAVSKYNQVGGKKRQGNKKR